MPGESTAKHCKIQIELFERACQEKLQGDGTTKQSIMTNVEKVSRKKIAVLLDFVQIT